MSLGSRTWADPYMTWTMPSRCRVDPLLGPRGALTVKVQDRVLARSGSAAQLGLSFLLQGVVLEAALTVALGMGTGGRAPRRPGAVGAVLRALGTMPISEPYFPDRRRGNGASTVVWAVGVDAFWTA
jgi:hypothetical protein